MDAQTRLCDLVASRSEGSGSSGDMVLGAKRCWETGLLFFPDNTVMRNELGNLLVQLGHRRGCQTRQQDNGGSGS